MSDETKLIAPSFCHCNLLSEHSLERATRRKSWQSASQISITNDAFPNEEFQSIFTQEQIRNWRIVIAIFELPSVHTRERRLLREWGEEAWLVSMFFYHADCCLIFIRKCVVYQQKLVHEALPPESQFRGQGIHTTISLRDLRGASMENTPRPSFELRNSNYANLRTHGPLYRHSNDA